MKVFIDLAAGSWFDIDSVKKFEARSARGIERKEALLVTTENNVIKALSETNDGKTSYSFLTYLEARNWFRANKFLNQDIPAHFRDFKPDLEIK